MEIIPLWNVICLGVLSVLVIVFNVAVCILVLYTRRLRTYTNGFVVSLASADILIGLALFIQYPLQVGNPVILNVMYATSLLSSVANLCAVTYDRYLAVVKPFKYTSTIERHFVRILIGVWAIGIVSAVLPLSWYWGSSKTSMTIHQIYQFVTLLFGIIIPFSLIFIGYWRIYRQVRICVKRERKLTKSLTDRLELTKCKNISSEAKLAKVFIVVTMMFVLSWLPVIYVTAVIAIGKPELMIPELNSCLPFTLALGSLVNPILYSFMKPDFKVALRHLRKTLLIKFKRERYPSNASSNKSTGDLSRLDVTVLSHRNSSVGNVSEV